MAYKEKDNLRKLCPEQRDSHQKLGGISGAQEV